MIGELYQDAGAVREWLSRAPKAYVRWLESMRSTEFKQLRNADEPKHLYRSQGRVEILDRLLGLEEELREKEKR